ncbi:hypothetical protein NKG94_21195 [Micromonospora sp. M12]
MTPASPPVEAASEASGPPPLSVPVSAPEGDDGGTSRINLRLPDHLKASVEDAAGRAGLSVNAWLVRAVAGAVGAGEPERRPPAGWSRAPASTSPAGPANFPYPPTTPLTSGDLRRPQFGRPPCLFSRRQNRSPSRSSCRSATSGSPRATAPTRW